MTNQNNKEDLSDILEPTIARLGQEIGAMKADMALKDSYINKQSEIIKGLEAKLKEYEMESREAVESTNDMPEVVMKGSN